MQAGIIRIVGATQNLKQRLQDLEFQGKIEKKILWMLIKLDYQQMDLQQRYSLISCFNEKKIIDRKSKTITK